MGKIIAITAGGTSEPIDTVRKITNSGSGRLGAMIATELLSREDVDKVIYIHSKKAILPTVVPQLLSNKLVDIVADSTMEVKDAVEDTLKNYEVDGFVHSMAISDYMVDYVSTAEMLADDITRKFIRPSKEEIEEVIKYPIFKLPNKSKISSSKDNLVVMLKPTPKIIGLIKEISPKTKLVGFKLLTDVSKEELISVASKLLEKNNCDYVIANDLTQINASQHIAYLLKKNDTTNMLCQTMATKEEIASVISKLF